jgi:hypothetical protein
MWCRANFFGLEMASKTEALKRLVFHSTEASIRQQEVYNVLDSYKMITKYE